MAETREVQDPFTGTAAKINNDLVRRLRGEYACGPTLENGEPEFGWRRFGEPIPINLEAADEIERLREALAAAEEGLRTCYQVCDYPADGQSQQDHALMLVRSALNMPTQNP